NATFSQLFAAVHDEQVANPGARNDSVVAIIRMANTAGWVIGPVIGAWVAASFGLRPMIWLTAICFLAQIAALGTLGTKPSETASAEAKPAPRRGPGLVEMLPLLAFTGLFVLVYAGEAIKYGFLLLYMEEQLRLEPAVRVVARAGPCAPRRRESPRRRAVARAARSVRRRDPARQRASSGDGRRP
ncbi:MAG: hypothetical protein J0I07_43160, partial [Myxococcales bacterium]|nr:hypothetical protein [Myxococcales bacterium]